MLEGVSDRVHLADQLKEKNEKLERLEHRLSILTKQLDVRSLRLFYTLIMLLGYFPPRSPL